MSEHSNLADQALNNLVNQFARPLDFLRELVQNSIDAGSPRIDVAIDFDADDSGRAGVTRIHVDDYGEGMDEAIIDNQLTRLFSSNKEDDLTKIGKFGIGFTSIFAILPEAVLLRTGKHGEYWELLFHADRSYEKRRTDEPVDGTKITLYKRMEREDLTRFIEEARFILTYWCEHSNIPITFWDRTQQATDDGPSDDDPFGAFANAESATGPEPINRPLSVQADVEIAHEEGEIQVVAGFGQQPLYGYYNGGLTLLRTRGVDALGQYASQLRHVRFKIKSDTLEHTLTRDNVLQDDHWHNAMKVAVRARGHLREALRDRLDGAIRAGEPVRDWQRYLTQEAQTPEGNQAVHQWPDAALFRDVRGAPLTLPQVTGQERSLGVVLVGKGKTPLHDALAGQNILIVEDTPESRTLLRATEAPPMFEAFARPRRVARASDVFVLPQVLEDTDLKEGERRLLAATAELLHQVVGRRLNLALGDFGGPSQGSGDDLCLNGPKDGKVFQRPNEAWFPWPAFVRWRTLLINRHHPVWLGHLLAGSSHLETAAFGLSSALLHVENIESESVHRALIDLAGQRLGGAA